MNERRDKCIMWKGKQTGYHWTDGTGLNGIYIEIDEYGVGVDFCRIIDGKREEHMTPGRFVDTYDTRQGTVVQGIQLMDYRGHPTNEVYKLSDFHMSGNLTYDTLMF